MPENGDSALIIPVPAAAALLARVAAAFPKAVREGDIGHVTMLYPFTATATPDQVAAVAAALTPIDVVLDRVVREPGFVALTADALGPLTSEVRSHWPEVLPYGGRFGPTPEAHLTLAMGVSDDEGDAIAAMASPVEARLSQLWLLTYENGWQVAARCPFGGSDQVPAVR
ncbi:2'-5' RNA ligase family protein [Kutzneria sp. CA-103260]|uniref:2'-5' RNA ligase family protein n=1 Tax=Kutzneria sp. CA-103260 TaxID=2802641 RepID=UPI001BA6B406|nr:2'-5' RNA ligase family protein [Kutzneria sp. CA-103260]QUQ62501.1 2'-5' RNA ligase superfamily protein [Kutzneria sp. CA-103260]